MIAAYILHGPDGRRWLGLVRRLRVRRVGNWRAWWELVMGEQCRRWQEAGCVVVRRTRIPRGV